MPIVPPDVFDRVGSPAFAWDEENTLKYFYYLPADLHDRLLAISPNACFALTIGSATWILARFAAYSPPPEPQLLIHAAWAEMTEDWHCARLHFPREDWRGPVLGPIASAMSVLYDAIDGRDHNPVLADRAVWMHNLAGHVIDPSEIYETWFEATLSRLERDCPWTDGQAEDYDIFDETFPTGGPVSPDFLMPDAGPDTALAAEQVRQHVERERRNGNPFVLDDQEFG